MSHILKAIAAASTREVVVGQFAYRIRAVSSKDLGEAGVGGLALIPKAEIAQAVRKMMAGDGADEAADPLKAAGEHTEALRQAIAKVSPKDLVRLQRRNAAVLCAGVLAVGGPVERDAKGEPIRNPDGSVQVGEWADVRIVLDENRANPEAGVISLSQVPGGQRTVARLSREITALSSDDGEAAALLASFRVGAGRAPAA